MRYGINFLRNYASYLIELIIILVVEFVLPIRWLSLTDQHLTLILLSTCFHWNLNILSIINLRAELLLSDFLQFQLLLSDNHLGLVLSRSIRLLSRLEFLFVVASSIYFASCNQAISNTNEIKEILMMYPFLKARGCLGLDHRF